MYLSFRAVINNYLRDEGNHFAFIFLLRINCHNYNYFYLYNCHICYNCINGERNY
jgi:hypothetical protein